MKPFAFFMACYILFLTVCPCMDRVIFHYDQCDAIAQTPIHSPVNDSHADCCTPFCSCQCCQSLFFVSRALTFIPSTTVTFVCHVRQLVPISVDCRDIVIPPIA